MTGYFIDLRRTPMETGSQGNNKQNITNDTNTSGNMKNKIITIPNLLSFFRLCLIPLFIWLFCVKEEHLWTGAVLLLSGITDMVDGYVARRFHMISDLGKVLDPIADKATQIAMLFCLLSRFPLMLFPLLLLILKEIFDGLTGLLVIRKTGQVNGAKWHGKVATATLYLLMIVHILWQNISPVISNLLIAANMVIMVISLFLYGKHNIMILKKKA